MNKPKGINHSKPSAKNICSTAHKAVEVEHINQSNKAHKTTEADHTKQLK
jgi:hypothetical protein